LVAVCPLTGGTFRRQLDIRNGTVVPPWYGYPAKCHRIAFRFRGAVGRTHGDFGPALMCA